MIDFNNKNVEMGVKTAVVAVGLLAVFLLSKTITEIASWSKDEMYPTKTITVTADGEALAVADIASFTFSVDEEGVTSDEAQNKATTKINKALDYLKSNGVDEKDIKTENYSIFPKYSNPQPCTQFSCPSYEQKIIGYTVSQSIRVKVRKIDDTGKFLSELTKLGINNMSGISFTIDDEEALRDEARADAIAKTKEKAKVLAQNLGVRLGDVISFNEDTPGMYPTADAMGGAEMGMSMKAAAPQIPAGENKYTSLVYVTYELK